MSMWLNLMQLTAPSFEKIRKDKEKLEALFVDNAGPEDFDAEDDTYGTDYLMIDEMLRASNELTEDDELGDNAEVKTDPLYRCTVGDGPLEHETGYGQAFYLSAASVQALAKELKDQYAGAGGDFDELCDFTKRAATRGCVIVGGIE